MGLIKMEARTKPPMTPAVMLKNRLPLSIFLSNSRSLPTSTASEIHSTFVIGRPLSPSSNLIRSLISHTTLICRPLVQDTMLTDGYTW